MDHRNLCYIFDPTATNPLAGKHTASHLECWAMHLIGLHYTIEFIPGDQNVFADLLTQWGTGTYSSFEIYVLHRKEAKVFTARYFCMANRIGDFGITRQA